MFVAGLKDSEKVKDRKKVFDSQDVFTLWRPGMDTSRLCPKV